MTAKIGVKEMTARRNDTTFPSSYSTSVMENGFNIPKKYGEPVSIARILMYLLLVLGKMSKNRLDKSFWGGLEFCQFDFLIYLVCYDCRP